MTDAIPPQQSEESRYNLLTDALQQSCGKITNNILSLKCLAECFPLLQKKYPCIVVDLQKILTNKIQTKVKEELDTLLLEIDLKANLDRIDQLENEQANLSKGEKVWRPSGNPGKDLLAHDYSVLQAHKEQLQLFSQELRSEVENDKERLVKVIEEIRKREDLIEEKLLKNEQSLQILGHGLK